MGIKDRKIRLEIFTRYLAMYIPLLVLYKLLGSTFTREVEGINFMMTVISIPSCFFYYKITKKDSYFIYFMFYLSLLLDNTYIHVASYYNEIDRSVPVLILLRCVLLLIVVLEFNGVIEVINKNIVKVFIAYTILNFTILIANNYIANKLYNSAVYHCLFIIGMVITVAIVIYKWFKSLRTKEFIEMVFLTSTVILTLRRVMVIVKSYLGIESSWLFDEKWVFCLALYILPIGLFVEYSCIIKENRNLEREVERISRDMKEFQEIDKLRTQFFANLSHEIKTPINIIFSGIQLIDSKKQEGDFVMINYYNKYSPMIRQNCFRILRLTNNLVDMTKLDAGFMNMNFKNVDIVNLVEDITMSVVQYVENKNINIIFDTLIEEKVIKCDKDGIERIILNLISNAIKFTNEDGNILVFIELEENYVVIRVKDDGIGIPKESREKVFNVFVQEDKSLKRKREGSGIGLSLVKAIVEKHDGIVICEDVEVGTEIVVKIPDVILEDEDVEYNVMSCEKDTIQKITTEFSDIYDL